MLYRLIKYLKTGTTHKERYDKAMEDYEAKLRYYYFDALSEGKSVEEIQIGVARAQEVFMLEAE